MIEVDWSIIISIAALTISIGTFGLTFFWGGRLKFSSPSQIQFFYIEEEDQNPGIYIRLYAHSSGLAGKLIDGLYLEVRRNETRTNFSNWMTNTGSGYRFLSGLKVMRDGVSLDNVFRVVNEETKSFFQPGEYELNLFSRESGKRHPKMIWSKNFRITNREQEIIEQGKFVTFTLSTDGKAYIGSTLNKTEDRDTKIINQFTDKIVEKITEIKT